MIATKSLIANIQDVPVNWAFEFYLKLPEQLCGQDLMIRSPFNSKDKVPSCSIYWHKNLGRYQFKDHSSGEGGSCQDLVRKLFDLTPGKAMFRIIEDYNQFILDNKGSYAVGEFKEHSKYKVASFVKRQWNTLDKKYWMQYGLGSRILEHYGVFPLETYKLEKEDSRERKILDISGYHIYGFFRSDGVLYKIYQPKVKDRKFIKIKDYIQGTDQLKFEAPILVICSSLKDLMCLANYGWNVESVAPHSENTLIPEHMMQAYKHKYKKIFTFFDNDPAGLKAMEKYKEKYDIDKIILAGEKDLSDNISIHGKEYIENVLRQTLLRKLKQK